MGKHGATKSLEIGITEGNVGAVLRERGGVWVAGSVPQEATVTEWTCVLRPMEKSVSEEKGVSDGQQNTLHHFSLTGNLCQTPLRDETMSPRNPRHCPVVYFDSLSGNNAKQHTADVCVYCVPVGVGQLLDDHAEGQQTLVDVDPVGNMGEEWGGGGVSAGSAIWAEEDDDEELARGTHTRARLVFVYTRKHEIGSIGPSRGGRIRRRGVSAGCAHAGAVSAHSRKHEQSTSAPSSISTGLKRASVMPRAGISQLHYSA